MTLSQTNPDQLLASGDNRASIARIGPDRRPEAVARLVGTGPGTDPDHARRFLEYARANRIDLDALFAAIDADGRILAATLAVPSPGRTAMFFSSHPQHRSEIPRVAELIAHAAIAIGREEVDLAQVLLDLGETLDRDAYTAAAFERLATLTYMSRGLRVGPRTPGPPPDGATFEPYRVDRRDELLELLDRTYEDTLDCPGLFGLRRTEDILVGHEATGIFDPGLWTILRIRGTAEGALLLNATPQQETVELVYLGLAQTARGRGLGRAMLVHGLRRLAGRSERTITLAVDERNEPAVRLYRRAGFKPSLRRIALIRPLQPPDAAPVEPTGA